MRILYRKGISNEASPVSRRPDFHSFLKLFMPKLKLLWDGNVPAIIYNGNALALLALSTLESLDVHDDFLSQLEGA